MWFLLSVAHAATPTELPPFLSGDASIAYSYDRVAGSLDERGDEDWDVGRRSFSTHLIDYKVAFGAAPGLAVRFDLPHYASSSIGFTAAQEMVYDPATGTGTYYGTDPLEPGTYVRGGGLGGLWLEIAGTPYSEAFVKRINHATWLLAGAWRAPDPTSFWAVDADGNRGAGPGGSAWRLQTAFSKQIGNAQPYLSGELVVENPTSVTLAAQDGTVLSDGEVEINPADHGNVRAGLEVVATRNPANGSMIALDLHVSLDYASAGDVPSGMFLPDVLDASLGTVVQQAETMDSGGGAGLTWRPFDAVQLRGWGELAYRLPQRIESPYPVYGWSNTTRVRAGLDLTVRIHRPALAD